MGKDGYFIMFIKVKSSNRISKRVLLRSLVLVCQTDKSATSMSPTEWVALPPLAFRSHWHRKGTNLFYSDAISSNYGYKDINRKFKSLIQNCPSIIYLVKSQRYTFYL